MAKAGGGPLLRRWGNFANGRKIARMARNWTIFGPNRSRRRELKLLSLKGEKNSNEPASEQTNETNETISICF